MKLGVIGGGMLGLSLAYYLQQRGHTVHLYEKNPFLGGLAGSFDYGSFVWDKFYHVILPQDTHLIGLLKEIGLEQDLRWRRTRTGYYLDGRFYSMSNMREMLRFPLLGWTDKLRMGLATVYTLELARPDSLYQVTARDWLIKVFGRSNYTNFWSPLLRAKFGEFADRIAAIFIWAALKRLFRSRRTVTDNRSMGYVHGGYRQILATLRDRLEAGGGRIHLDARIGRIADGNGSSGCRIEVCGNENVRETHSVDKVIFTAPTKAAEPILSDRFKQMIEDGRPTTYLGVVCLAVVLRRSLTPYYVVNIADRRIPLTGLIEMTSLIDADEETGGLSLVYLPRYVDSGDRFLRAADTVVFEELFAGGLKAMFPELTPEDVVSWHIQRAPYVQPVPLVRPGAPRFENRMPRTDREFIVANTALLACPTLNNDEVVRLAKEVASRF